MDLRFRVADLLSLEPSGSGRLTEADLARIADGQRSIEAKTTDGRTFTLDIGIHNVGLVAHLVGCAKVIAADGIDNVTIPQEVLERSPTERVLDACDSYRPSLRSMAPAQVMDVLLANPDPKVGVFAGGLFDEAGSPRTYRVVGPDGELETRTASYDGSKLYLYVADHEHGAIEKMRAVQEKNDDYGSIEIVPFSPGELSSREARLDTRFDRPGVIWISSRCEAVPELKDDDYLVPGSRFAIEVYYHDARINAPGAKSTIDALIERGDEASVERAKQVLSALRGTTNAFVNQVNTLGKVLNANLTLYAGRTQPPALTTCIRETYDAWTTIHADDPVQIEHAQAWLRWATDAAVREYENVWTAEPRLDVATGLSRFVDEVPSEAPEEPAEHYDGMVWNADAIQSDAAVREHGWDSHVGAMALEGPYAGQPIQHRMLPVCLNSVLFKVENDLAALHRTLGDDESKARAFEDAAEQRKVTMNRLMWNDELGLYSDLIFDPEDTARSPADYVQNTYEDLRSMLPMWAGIVPPKSWRAQAMFDRVADFKRTGGLATATRRSWDRAVELNENYVDRCQWGQWDVGWPIATYETIEGLRNCGFEDMANELAYRWCWTVQREVERQGGLQPSERGEYEAPVTEKLDVVALSLEDSAEKFGYGNQGRGTDGHGAGFRWGYDAFKLLARSLPPELAESLAAQTHPDALFVGPDSPPLPQTFQRT